jgi:hypothetical protein
MVGSQIISEDRRWFRAAQGNGWLSPVWKTSKVLSPISQVIGLRSSKGMKSERIKEQIRENAAEIVRLHSRIKETYLKRSKSPENRREWDRRVQNSIPVTTAWYFQLGIREEARSVW